MHAGYQEKAAKPKYWENSEYEHSFSLQLQKTSFLGTTWGITSGNIMNNPKNTEENGQPHDQKFCYWKFTQRK